MKLLGASLVGDAHTVAAKGSEGTSKERGDAGAKRHPAKGHEFQSLLDADETLPHPAAKSATKSGEKSKDPSAHVAPQPFFVRPLEAVDFSVSLPSLSEHVEPDGGAPDPGGPLSAASVGDGGGASPQGEGAGPLARQAANGPLDLAATATATAIAIATTTPNSHPIATSHNSSSKDLRSLEAPRPPDDPRHSPSPDADPAPATASLRVAPGTAGHDDQATQTAQEQASADGASPASVSDGPVPERAAAPRAQGSSSSSRSVAASSSTDSARDASAPRPTALVDPASTVAAAPSVNVMTGAKGVSVTEHVAAGPSAASETGGMTSALNQQVLRSTAHGVIELPELGRIQVSARAQDGELGVRVMPDRPETTAVLVPHAAAMAAEARGSGSTNVRVDVESRHSAMTSHAGGSSGGRHEAERRGPAVDPSEGDEAIAVDSSAIRSRVRIVL